MRRTSGQLLRWLSVPPDVIGYRIRQAARLRVWRHLHGWGRLERRLREWWTPERARALAAGWRPVVLAEDAIPALREAVDRGFIDRGRLTDYGSRLQRRDFRVLGAAVPPDGAWPWHSDWRYDHTWPPAHFATYDHYRRDRGQPWDVKIPWELSRLTFVLPVLEAAALTAEEDAAWALEAIADWERSNPLGHSVNWYPMEASMRGIDLVLALEMALQAGRPEEGPAEPVSADRLVPVLRLIAGHGEFVWRTVEYTGVRGNHYAANLVALLLCGLALRDHYSPASRWVDDAALRIAAEIEAQFLPDGVNFEKSVAYHRLVAELFLVAAMALDRCGRPLSSAARERLRAACGYSAACRRPDGWAPNVGDNDDARVLVFDPVDPRDHGPLVGVGAAYFDEVGWRAAAEVMPAAVPWLVGQKGVDAWAGLAAELRQGARFFHEGGVVTVRHRGSFLWMDVGEVGGHGRGGHGHNDLLSFELCLGGRPLVVDPGCPVYTGDAATRDLFRSTAYHNGLRLDGREIADLGGMWEIADQARPRDVEVLSEGSRTTIHVAHTGYLRLSDPARHSRELVFDAAAERLSCTDRLVCRGQHEAERFLHLDPSVEVDVEEQAATLRRGGEQWTLEWDRAAQVSVIDGLVSPGYGVTEPARVVILRNRIEGETELWFGIKRG